MYNKIKHELIFSSPLGKNLFNNSITYIFCSISNKSIPDIIKHELNSHKIALYKNDVISSFFITLLHIKIF